MRRTRSSWEKDGTIPKMAGVMLIFLPSLLFSAGIGYLKMKRDAKRSSKIFKQQLQQQGLTRDQAGELTELYLQSSRLSTYFRS